MQMSFFGQVFEGAQYIIFVFSITTTTPLPSQLEVIPLAGNGLYNFDNGAGLSSTGLHGLEHSMKPEWARKQPPRPAEVGVMSWR